MATNVSTEKLAIVSPGCHLGALQQTLVGIHHDF